ncbi:gliding motility-associated C-terminal domain-containing protein [Mucilaginibacter sp.]|uniref:Ig-like domain-containing protein n=1 Tax=Mucilaginibacter sp. TaxID=1882438 RepID=UPI003D14BACF
MYKLKNLILTVTFFILLFPLIGNCQISVPKWVDDIGGPGPGSSIPASVKVDSQNNIYITGIYSGTVDFDPSASAYNLTSVGDFDVYVAKYTTTGTLIWAVSIGGSGLDQVNDMALDANGNPTITGQYNSPAMDVDPSAATSIINNNGDNDAFIVKFDTNGKLIWGKSVGGPFTDYGNRVATDAFGDVIEVIKYQSTIIVGANSYSSQGSFNGMIIKYDPAGNVLWAVNLADNNDSETRAVTVDSNSNIIVSGNFSGADNFDPLGSGYTLNGNGAGIFLAKYSPAGALTWATSLSGTATNNNIYLCVNSSNDVFLDAPFSSVLGFNSNTTTLNAVGNQDIFLAKYSSSGNYQWVKDIGASSATVYNYGIVSSKDDNLYISGYFSGTVDFDPSTTSVAPVSDHGQRDLFFAKYDSNGDYKWAFSAGNANCSNTLGRNLAVDGNNDVLLVGSFCTTVNFDASKCSTYNLTAQSDVRDSFIAKYIQSTPTPASQITAFSVSQQVAPANIDQTKLQITVTVPQGTDVTALKPSITVSSGVTLSPASGATQSFTAPVAYKLSSPCASLNYTVNVVYAGGTTPAVPPSNAQVCATAGADGPTNINGSINSYFPPSGYLTLAAGGNTISLGAIPPTDTHGNSFGTVPIKAGDLLLIMQMQDATINFSNSTLYGGNNSTLGPDGLGATGNISTGNSGKFEYIIATNNIPLTGGTLTFKGSGTGGGTVYSYINAAPTATSGKKTFQVIRIPQYSNLKLTSNVSPPPFNGTAGGIIAFDVSGNMDFNGFTIDVTGRGFRGGYSLVKTSVSNINDLYVAAADDQRVSGKGEGIAGTPRYVWDGYNAIDNVIEGLPGGSGGRGAPANAGGGGNDSNAGGGGGANGGAGGNGGGGYEPIGGTLPSGGRPGLNLSPDVTTLVMGGGGGGGHANDALTGVKGGVGGGIVIITAATIIGTGTVSANGADGAPGVYGSHPDGSGGGGSGGTVFIKVSNPNASANLTINANGGLGGNTQNDPGGSGVQPHGPGGGGGGGNVFYAISSGTVNVNINGGASGKSNGGAGIPHFATDGQPGTKQTISIASLPPYLQGNSATCYPILVTTMRAKAYGIPVSPGSTATYFIRISNNATGGNAGGVEADHILPTGFSFKDATVQYYGAASGPAVLTNSGTPNKPLLGDFNIPAGDSVVITLDVTIDCVATGTYNSSVEALYLDPTRDYTTPNRRITAVTNAFTGVNTTYFVGAAAVPGSNYNGTASTTEDFTVNNSSIINNTITLPAASAIYCVNGDPPVITGSTPTSSGTFVYQWQSSADGVNFTDITGVISKDYDPPLLSQTTYYRRTVVATTCPAPSYSNVIKITILPALANNTITAPPITEFCVTGDAGVINGSFPSGGDQSYNYLWQSSTDGVNFTFIQGVTTINYDPPVANVTTYYRRTVATIGCSTPLVSNIITISIIPAVTNNTITAPTITTFCASGSPATITGSLPAGGNGTYTYQWQSSADNVTFNDVTGANAIDYTPASVTATTYYRRTVVSGGCIIPAISNVVTITVIPAIANNTITAPAITNFCLSGDAAVITGSTPTGGNGVYTYQWQSSADNVNFTNIAGATAIDYDPGILNVTTYYRRTIISGVCTTPNISNIVTITILSAVANNTITAPAQSSFCVTGSPSAITGSTPTGGNGIYTYQWQNSDDGVNFTDIAGATAIDYMPPTITTTTYYRRTAISGVCTTPVISNVVKLTILPALASNSISPPLITNFCSSVNPGIIPGGFTSGGTGTYTYVWQSSTDGVNFTDIPGATGIDYDPPAFSITTYFRRLVTSGACNVPLISNVIKFTIKSSPTNVVVAAATVPICSGNTATLSVASPQSDLTYYWFDSPAKNNLVYTGPTFVTNPLTANTTYYVEASNDICTSPALTSVQVTVNAVPAAPAFVTNPIQVCSGSIAMPAVSNTQSALTYNWYTAATGGTAIFTGNTYTTPALTANTTYYVDATNGSGCTSVSRTAVNITVNPLPVVTAQGNSTCPGTTTTLTASSDDPFVTINWYASATGGNILFTGSTFTTPAVNANTTYYAEAVATTTGCVSASRAAAQAQLIVPLAAPVVKIDGTTVSSVTFAWNDVSGATGYQVSIDNGQTFTDPSSGSDGLTHTVTGLLLRQSVTIQVRAIGSASCQLSGSSTAVTGIAASPLGDYIFVPNAFTPNGDGKNDIVYVQSENIKTLKFYVYDQWGELLYASFGQQNGWDGTYKGNKEPVGVYVYYLEAVMNDGQQITKKGTITLIR